jgi:hypothetical protein
MAHPQRTQAHIRMQVLTLLTHARLHARAHTHTHANKCSPSHTHNTHTHAGGGAVVAMATGEVRHYVPAGCHSSGPRLLPLGPSCSFPSPCPWVVPLPPLGSDQVWHRTFVTQKCDCLHQEWAYNNFTVLSLAQRCPDISYGTLPRVYAHTWHKQKYENTKTHTCPNMQPQTHHKSRYTHPPPSDPQPFSPCGPVLGLSRQGNLYWGANLVAPEVTSMVTRSGGPGGPALLFCSRRSLMYTGAPAEHDVHSDTWCLGYCCWKGQRTGATNGVTHWCRV